MTIPSTQQIFTAVRNCRNLLLIHIAVVLAFLAFSFLQPYIVSTLNINQVDLALVEMVGPAFARYESWVLAMGIVISALLLWKAREEPLTLTPGKIAICVILDLCLFYLLLTRCLQFPIASDDSYIDYRYVRNWVNGWGFDYNPGQRVMGFTSHLHVVLLTVVAFVFNNHQIDVVSQMVNVLFQCVTFYLLYAVLSHSLNPASSSVGCVLYALNPYQIGEAVGGKESSIVTALMLLSLWALQRRRIQLFAWCGVLIFLARPEGIVWCGLSVLVSLFVLRTDVKKFLVCWLPPFSLAVAVYGFLYLYFGTVIPHGSIAKHLIYLPKPMGSTLSEIAFFIDRTVVDTLVGTISATSKLFMWFDSANELLIYPAVILLILMLVCCRMRPWLLLYPLSVIGVSAFFVATNPLMFSWYYCWFSLFGSLQIPIWLDSISAKARQWRQPSLHAFAGLLLLYFVAVPIAQQPRFWGLWQPLFFCETHQYRVHLYAQAAKLLNKLPNRPLVASEEPGMMGYAYLGRLLDLDGLVSPEMLKYYPLPPEKLTCNTSIPPQAVNALAPEYVVFYHLHGKDFLLSDSQFLSSYSLEKTWDDKDRAGSFENLFLYKRIK